jgi:hypothetical protein
VVGNGRRCREARRRARVAVEEFIFACWWEWDC